MLYLIKQQFLKLKLGGKHDIGKTTEQIELERIYDYLKENGQILI